MNKECENCKEEHDGSYGSGRFCSTKCARGFSTKAKRKEINEKISRALGGRVLKPRVCNQCNNSINFKRKKYCNECSKYSKRCYFYKNINTYKKGISFSEINKNSIELIYNEYIINELSLNDLATKYNVAANTIKNFLIQNGIKTRTIKESIGILVENGKLSMPHNYMYKSGFHTSWDGITYFYRSSYEHNVMVLFDENKIKYLYEKKRIKYYDTQKGKNRISIPDFYLPVNNTIVEIKSEYTLDPINMKDKFRKYKDLGYNAKLFILDNDKTYNQLIQYIKKII